MGGVLREVLGLTRRRASERALFLTPVEAAQVRDPEQMDENSRATPVEDSPRRGNIAESRTVQGATIAGGAGVAASTVGKENAEELDQIETNIQNGTGLTENSGSNNSSAGEGSTPPSGETEGQNNTGEDSSTTSDGHDSSDLETGETVGMPDRPSKHEIHAAEAQIQFALLILIVLSVLFVIFARFDDWRNYRR